MKQNPDHRNHMRSDSASHYTLITPPPSPPSEFISPFKSIEEWLVHLCESNQPKETHSEYYFELMKLTWNNVIRLMGLKTISVDDNTTQRIFYTLESNSDFPLPRDKYGSLSQQQLNELVMIELVEFTRSDIFLTSFLAKAKLIQTNIHGKIWPM